MLRRQDGALQRRSTPIWRRWREEGLPALSDKPRCGAPRQWDEEDAQRLGQWAREQPLSAHQRLQRHTDASGKPVHVGTLVRYLNSSHWCSTAAEIFLGFVAALAKTAPRPLVILIDNASIHCARAISAALRLLEKKSITLKFLPPYSPEINRIEKLWWLMKHRWMALPRRTKVELEQTVNHILTNQFKMAF